MSIRFSPEANCWLISCDAPGCRDAIAGLGTTDTAQRRHATAEAEIAGWQLSTHEAQRPDFCRMHAGPEWPARVTPLYRNGQALPYSRRG